MPPPEHALERKEDDGNRDSGKLTQQIVDAATCPPDQAEAVWHDKELPGSSSGCSARGRRLHDPLPRRRAWLRQRRLTLDARKIPLGEARREIRRRLGEIATGRDPVGERRRSASATRPPRPRARRLRGALERRQVVKRGEVLSLLRRELSARSATSTWPSSTAQQMSSGSPRSRHRSPGRRPRAEGPRDRVPRLGGRRGLDPGQSLAGWRRPRATRAERLAPVGRALADPELPAFWNAASAAPWPFDGYLKVLLLCGQRRSETAAMRWADIDPDAATWTIPAAISKSGREHIVPLPPAVMEIIRATGRTTSPLVFPGRGGAIMSGWEKRVAPVREASGLAHWTLHDLRRTFRSGLSALRVDYAVRELMLNHVIGDDLDQRYDREPRWRPGRSRRALGANTCSGSSPASTPPRWCRCGRDKAGPAGPARSVLAGTLRREQAP